MAPPTQTSPLSFKQEFRDRFREKRILVTGATGFLGINLCGALETVGAQVLGAALPDSLGPTTGPLRILPVDLAEDGSAQRLIQATDPKIIFHLAGMVDTRQSPDLVLLTLRHNLLGAVNLMAELVGTSCERMVVLTSAEAPRGGQIPISPYAASKLAMVSYAEMYHALYNLPVVIARPHLVYGPHQPPDKLIPYLIRCCIEHVPPELSSGRRLCDPIYVKDVVRALLHMAIADKVPGLTLDIGTGKGHSVAEIAALVLQLMDADTEPIFGAIPDRVGEVPQVADIAPTEAAIAWSPAWSLEAGLSETIDWYRARSNPLPSTPRPAPGEVLR